MAAASSECDEPWDCRLHLGFVRAYSEERTGHFFDFFSGAGQASQTFKGKGYKTHCFDILSGGNLVTRTGFFTALSIFMGLVRGALVLLGPPCSLWVYMSNSYHGRRKHLAAGNLSRAAVRAANTLIRNVCFLLALGHYRGVFFILEQPSSSHMRNYSWIQRLAEALLCKKVHTWLKEFGHQIPKPTYLLSNMVRAGELRRIWSKRRELKRKDVG